MQGKEKILSYIKSSDIVNSNSWKDEKILSKSVLPILTLWNRFNRRNRFSLLLRVTDIQGFRVCTEVAALTNYNFISNSPVSTKLGRIMLYIAILLQKFCMYGDCMYVRSQFPYSHKIWCQSVYPFSRKMRVTDTRTVKSFQCEELPDQPLDASLPDKEMLGCTHSEVYMHGHVNTQVGGGRKTPTHV